MSKLLLEKDELLIIFKKLACEIGLNESIVLQQVHYWTQHNATIRRNYHEGYYWTYNTYQEWQKDFPFWSIPTIKRTFLNLEKKGYLISGNFNKMKIDRTKWYRIDHDMLQTLDSPPLYQNDPFMVSDRSNGTYQIDPTNTKDLPETSAEPNTLYITLTSDDQFLSFYLKAHQYYLHKEHVRVTEDQLDKIESDIAEIKSCDIEFEEWKGKVIEHFENLPATNNGNILAFLAASMRHFEVNPYY